MTTANASGLLRLLLRGMIAEARADQPDSELVDRLLARRDEAAFAAVVHRHGAMVYRACWRVLRQAEDAEDAFQATFLVLAQRLDTLRRGSSLAAWLHGVAHRVALEARGRAAARRRHESHAPTSAATPTDELTRGELRAAFDEELVSLPERWRAPLVLCHLEGRTRDEAAAQLGWGKNTLRRRLQEAREALGRRLARRGVVGPTALAGVLLSECAAAASPGLLGKTVAAAAEVACGRAEVLAVASAKVAALTKGALTPMVLTKVKVWTAVLLGAVVAVAGVGFARDGLRADTLIEEKKAPPAKKPGEDKEAKRRKAELAALAGVWEKKDKKAGDLSMMFNEDGEMHLRWRAPEGYDGWGGPVSRGIKFRCEAKVKGGKKVLVISLATKRKVGVSLDKPLVVPYRLKGDTLTLDGGTFDMSRSGKTFLKAELKGTWKRGKDEKKESKK